MSVQRILSAIAMLTVLACCVAPSGAAPGKGFPAPVASCDLAAASVRAASAGAPAWNSQTHVVNRPGIGAEIVPPATIVPGRFAAARFRGGAMSWVGFDTLVLDVRSQGEGELVIVLSEFDEGVHEDYTLRLESIPSGSSALRFRLAPTPEGDLKPSPLTRDGEWNPDDLDGVNLILADYPQGFAILGMRLEMSQK